MLIVQNRAINIVFRALRKIGAASGCGGKRVADRGAGGRRERGLRGGRDERMVKGREGEERAALYARMR